MQGQPQGTGRRKATRARERKRQRKAGGEDAAQIGEREQVSGDQFANGFNELGLMQGIRKKDADKLTDTGKEEVSLNGDSAVRFAGVEGERILEDVNGSFDGDSVPVKVVPMFSVSGDAGIEAKILVGVSVDTLAVRGIGAGMLTDTNAGRPLLNGSGTYPLEAWGPILASGFAEKGKGFAGNGANRSAEGVEIGV